MTPLKTTARVARRLERNLGKSASAPSTSGDTSYILRILWAGWEAGRGRPPTHDDIQKLSVPMLNIAKRYLPELQKRNKTKKGQTK